MDNNEIQKVTVVDVNMSFLSMVSFMVRWTIAAIPALLILLVIGVFFMAVLAAIGMR